MPMASTSRHRAVMTGSNSAMAVSRGARTGALDLAEPGQRARDLAQLARRARATRGFRHAPGADRFDHPLDDDFVDGIEVHVVEGHHRGLVARREALLLLQGEQAVSGDALG